MKDPYAHIPQKYKEGHCFSHAATYVMDNARNTDLRLVHGKVTGTGVIAGLRIVHAWVEDIQTGMCIDPSQGFTKPLILPRLAYYHLGKVEPAETRHYTRQEMYEHLAIFAHYGPWDSLFDLT